MALGTVIPPTPVGEFGSGTKKCVFEGRVGLSYRFTNGGRTCSWTMLVINKIVCRSVCTPTTTQGEEGNTWNIRKFDSTASETPATGIYMEKKLCCGPCYIPPHKDNEWRLECKRKTGVPRGRLPDFLRNIQSELYSGTNPGSISDAALIIIRRQLLNFLAQQGMPDPNCAQINNACDTGVGPWPKESWVEC